MNKFKVGDRVWLISAPPNVAHTKTLAINVIGVVIDVTERGYSVEFDEQTNGVLKDIPAAYLQLVG